MIIQCTQVLWGRGRQDILNTSIGPSSYPVMSLKSRRAAQHHSKHSKLPLMWFNIIIMWLINMINKL